MNKLCIDVTSLLSIAEKVGTPVYCYSLNAIRRNYKEFADNLPECMICYAVKANPNIAIIKAIADMGGGADVVSEGEVRRALIAGIPANKIVFSGIGKSKSEIKFALKEGVYQINVESLEELNLINSIAADMKLIAQVAIRINPNIDAKTNDKITTGLRKNKFGIPEEHITKIVAEDFPNIVIQGISIHIGSQISNLAIILKVTHKIKELVTTFEKSNHKITRLDIGGGLGIPYADDDVFPSITDYARVVRENLCNLGCKIICEPGRAIVGNSGILLTKVLYTKRNDLVKHVVVDAGMNDLVRPALYGSSHRILPVKNDIDSSPKEIIDIVGPVCESDDIFAHRYTIQSVESGDLLAICDAGAYGASMSSTYNSRPLVPEVLVNNDQYALIRKRELYDEMCQRDIIPDFLYK